MSTPAERSPSRDEGRSTNRIRSSSLPHSETAAERLNDDLLVEILSRVPAKSLCRFKCVSNHWLSLIHHPYHRKKLPQTMVGFFYTSTSAKPCPEKALRFVDVSGSRRRPLISPSFAFLPNRSRLDFLDSCNGLFLCRWYGFATTQGVGFRYVVCNPTTKQWVALPDRSQAIKVGTERLGFDPAVSSHFHVFVLLLGDELVVTGVDVYSSKTRRWVHKDRGGEAMQLIGYPLATVFLNGYLHFHTADTEWAPRLSAVDTEGERWVNFNRPADLFGGFIQQSQGRLHYAKLAKDERWGDADIRLVVYVMDDYDSKEWTVRHSIQASHIFEGLQVDTITYFGWIAIHPDCNQIFFTVPRDIPLLCYDMNRRQAKLIPDLGNVHPPYVPYVPLYSELQSLHM